MRLCYNIPRANSQKVLKKMASIKIFEFAEGRPFPINALSNEIKEEEEALNLFLKKINHLISLDVKVMNIDAERRVRYTIVYE